MTRLRRESYPNPMLTVLRNSLRIPLALLVISTAGIFVVASPCSTCLHDAHAFQDQTKRNDRPQLPETTTKQRPENKKASDPTRYSYEFSQPQFILRRILVEHDASGRGQITFERKDEETPIVEPIELSMGALGRILGLWTALRFLDSSENYQTSRQYAHLGTMRLRMDDGNRKRIAEFNWSHNNLASALVAEYRKVADQAIFVFDINLAREIRPLSTPQLMNQLELLYTRNGLSDPQQLTPLLRELRTDDHIPLMARNHADRLLKKFEK
jgi:hypothetical protein